MALSSNLSLAMIPFYNQESLLVLPTVLYIDLTGVTRYFLMEDASVQGEKRNQGLEKGNMSARSKGEHRFLSQDRENRSDDENVTLFEMLSQIRFCSKRSSSSCNPLAMILSETQEDSPSFLPAKVPVRVTRSVQRTRHAEILAESTKKNRTRKCKYPPSLTSVEIVDDVADTVNSQKRKKFHPN